MSFGLIMAGLALLVVSAASVVWLVSMYEARIAALEAPPATACALGEAPTTDAEALLAWATYRDPVVTQCLSALYRLSRERGASVAHAYRHTLAVHHAAVEDAMRPHHAVPPGLWQMQEE